MLHYFNNSKFKLVKLMKKNRLILQMNIKIFHKEGEVYDKL